MSKIVTFSEMTEASRKRLEENQRIFSRGRGEEGIFNFPTTESFSESRISNVFLSHSSEDNRYLNSVKNFLETYNAKVYVDTDDKKLDGIVTKKTALTLKQNIKDCEKLIVFVTNNTKSSKWIPWELGLGDGLKGEQNIALLMSQYNHENENWSKEAYFDIYPCIKKEADGKFYVQQGSSYKLLEEWLEK